MRSGGERIPFIFEAKACDWDDKLANGIQNWANGLKGIHQENQGKELITVDWEQFFDNLKREIVKSLQECDRQVLKNWERIYKHSYHIKSNKERREKAEVTVQQQAAALAGGIPAAGALGLGAVPFCKFCLKFFSK